jgi:mRNA interferase RelE/StbE
MNKWSKGLKKMAVYKVFFKKSVRKDFQSIPKKELTRILEQIDSLSSNPRPPYALKLSGNEWCRIRQGKYRILYSIQDEELTMWVVKVAHRKKAYR